MSNIKGPRVQLPGGAVATPIGRNHQPTAFTPQDVSWYLDLPADVAEDLAGAASETGASIVDVTIDKPKQRIAAATLVGFAIAYIIGILALGDASLALRLVGIFLALVIFPAARIAFRPVQTLPLITDRGPISQPKDAR